MTLQVPLISGSGTTSATFQFVDDQFSLDSDDTGLVYVTIGGRREVAQLPGRACVGL